ncbi:hypothetical protein MMAGJ_63270 [Mycolicibacterium mageritense]|uniref:Uncharacterized protein n=1 Tax=Mycolicibacterium mageritense TaxID=53462 RepID=A0ABM7I2C2_MYCME|nr:hypothetical protein MMAGJ_63270 [Mycolicibacterium mageritense]GJJ23962.1 hypothetical protein MTY414_76360 [Mycolicibacterium mageritense]
MVLLRKAVQQNHDRTIRGAFVEDVENQVTVTVLLHWHLAREISRSRPARVTAGRPVQHCRNTVAEQHTPV